MVRCTSYISVNATVAERYANCHSSSRVAAVATVSNNCMGRGARGAGVRDMVDVKGNGLQKRHCSEQGVK